MKSFLFPGQGSQSRGMGEALFSKYSHLTSIANDLLGYDLATLCGKDPERLLNKTQYTQPALYVVDALAYLDRCEKETKPDYVAGHSLGEYVALFVAGAFSFETGLRLVKKRAETMALIKNGGMAALLGLSIEQVQEILKKHNYDHIDIANYNSAQQIVLSGSVEDISGAQKVFESNGAKLYFPLNVSGAFHSRYMKEAATEFGAFIRSFSFSPLQIPVISNVTARPFETGEIANLLERQMISPVRWYESLSYLLHKGVSTFLEIGPGDVLTKILGFIKDRPMVIPNGMPTGNGGSGMTDPATSVPHRSKKSIFPEAIGSPEFLEDYNLKYAYLTGAMVHGIASKELVIRMGKAGMMGYLGTGGMKIAEMEKSILCIKEELKNGEPYGVNLLNGPRESQTVDLLLKHRIRNIEAAAYMQVTEELVRLRVKGIHKKSNGAIEMPTRILAKVSRPEVAAGFLSPPPSDVVQLLLQRNMITEDEAVLSGMIPMADDICVESDSGGHTDMGVAFTLVPTMIRLRDDLMNKYKYIKRIRVGAAGGIGTPEAAASAFVLGADFILTGSINQCTVEAGTSRIVKEMLQGINVQDTDYAPAGDMFEIGARVQVLKKGVFFPSRANKLYNLYCQYNSLNEIDEKTRVQIQERYFQRSFEEIYKDIRAYYSPQEVAAAERNPRQMMGYVFRWYFGYTNQLALRGDEKNKVDFQIHCGPAMGAFNQWVKNTRLEDWSNRHVDEIALKIMHEAADVLNLRMKKFYRYV